MSCIVAVLAIYGGNLAYISIQEQGQERAYVEFSKTYFLALYGEENALSTEVDEELKRRWSDVADEHLGIKHLTLVTKVCERPAETPSLHHCYLSYQTHFNDGTSTMTYSMELIGDSGEPVTLEPHNIEGGVMLLTEPQSFKIRF